MPTHWSAAPTPIGQDTAARLRATHKIPHCKGIIVENGSLACFNGRVSPLGLKTEQFSRAGRANITELIAPHASNDVNNRHTNVKTPLSRTITNLLRLTNTCHWQDATSRIFSLRHNDWSFRLFWHCNAPQPASLPKSCKTPTPAQKSRDLTTLDTSSTTVRVSSDTVAHLQPLKVLMSAMSALV